MRLMRTLLCLLLTGAASGATVVVNLGVDDPATARTYSVDPGSIDIKLVNAFPNKTYEIIGENRQKTATPRLPDGVTAASAKACEATNEQVRRILDDALTAKKAKVAVDKQADVKLTEADIAAALEGDLGCTTAEKAKLDEDKAKFAADKAKFDADPAKPAAEKTRLDAEKTRLDKIEADNATQPKIRDRFSVTFDGYTLKEGASIQKKFKVVGEDTTWTVVITAQGASAAVTAKAASKAANPLAADSPILDRLLNTTATHPDLVVGTCKYTDPACAARIYINADQLSTLTITDIPQGAVTVRVTGGEYFPCQSVSYNIAKFEKAPDKLILPLHMKKGILGIGSLNVAKAEVEAAAVYGLDWCPGTNRVLQKTRALLRDMSAGDYVSYVEKRESVDSKQGKDPGPPWKTLAAVPDPRTRAVKSPPIASLPLFLRAKSQIVEVQFEWADGTAKTFTFPVVYQRFWLDAGGFFVFARRTDQSIDTETITGAVELQKVRAIRREVSIEPATGIVINVHPGNFPILAFQFGIAANQGRAPSYYGGIGLRAREIGKRGLATLGIGVAMQQEDQFPLLQFGGEYPSTSPLLKPTSKYGLTFPYISLSLGFSFGGVSEKTNVADSVSSGQ